jgi:hypothetical protein
MVRTRNCQHRRRLLRETLFRSVMLGIDVSWQLVLFLLSVTAGALAAVVLTRKRP